MLETDRRGFLKGLLAVMAVAAMPAPVMAAVEVVSHEVGLPSVEEGEIWFCMDGEWRLFGVASNWAYRGDRDAIRIGANKFQPGILSHYVKADVICDADGVRMVEETFMFLDPSDLRVAFGMSGGWRLISMAVIDLYEIQMERGGAMTASVEFRLTGEPERSFS